MDNENKAFLHIRYKGINDYGIPIYEQQFICSICRHKLNIFDENQLIKGLKCEKCNCKLKGYEEFKEEK